MMNSAVSTHKPATMWTISVLTDSEFASTLLHGIYPVNSALRIMNYALKMMNFALNDGLLI